MSRRVWMIVLLLAIGASTLHAQIVVIDPANLVETVLIASRTERHYEELVAEFQIIQRMAHGLAGLDQYRIPAIAITGHDPARWAFGRPWIQGLNSGDASGALYLSTALPLERPDPRLAQLPLSARQAFERRYATVEITDSVAMMGGHQVALTRNYHDRLQQAVQDLQRDVLNNQPGYHEDRHPRQDRRGRAAGAPPGHGQQPAPLTLARTAPRAQQAAAGYRSRDHQHAARHVAGRPGGQRGVRGRHRGCAPHVAAEVGGGEPCGELLSRSSLSS